MQAAFQKGVCIQQRLREEEAASSAPNSSKATKDNRNLLWPYQADIYLLMHGRQSPSRPKHCLQSRALEALPFFLAMTAAHAMCFGTRLYCAERGRNSKERDVYIPYFKNAICGGSMRPNCFSDAELRLMARNDCARNNTL